MSSKPWVHEYSTRTDRSLHSALLGCTPPAEITPEPAPLVLRKAHELTADEFLNQALAYAEEKRTIDQFYAKFGEPPITLWEDRLEDWEEAVQEAREEGLREPREVEPAFTGMQYDCRDSQATLIVDPDRWEAGYVVIVDVEQE